MKPTRLYPAKSNAPSFASFPPHITAELHRYDAYLRDVRGLAAETRKNRLRVVGLLLRDRFERCAIDFRKVRPDDVRQFLSAQLRAGGSASYASHLAATLRRLTQLIALSTSRPRLGLSHCRACHGVWLPRAPTSFVQG